MISMNICCPLCGRHVPEDVFDPSEFEDDIYAVEVSGLGRGRGFQVTDRYSVLDDPAITGLIADRCHRILHLIDEEDYLPPEEYRALRATLDSWVKYARRLEAENENLKEELEEDDDDEYEDDDDDSPLVSRLLQKINRETSYEFDDLEEAVGFLLEG
jgi:hypothetical protein